MPSSTHSRLHLVVRGREEAEDPRDSDDLCSSSRVIHARPGDRLEPWPLRDAERVDAFARASRRAGAQFDVAARAVIERSLLVADLIKLGNGDAVDDLNALAEASTIQRPLTDGLAAYLRGLSSRDAATRGPYLSVAIPVRLRERLGEGDPGARLDVNLISVALDWERAAVVQGMTMTEWGAFAALARKS